MRLTHEKPGLRSLATNLVTSLKFTMLVVGLIVTCAHAQGDSALLGAWQSASTGLVFRGLQEDNGRLYHLEFAVVKKASGYGGGFSASSQASTLRLERRYGPSGGVEQVQLQSYEVSGDTLVIADGALAGTYARVQDRMAGLWHLEKDDDGVHRIAGVHVFVVGDVWFRSIRHGIYCSGGTIVRTKSGALELVSLWGAHSADGMAARGLPARENYFLLDEPGISKFSEARVIGTGDTEALCLKTSDAAMWGAPGTWVILSHYGHSPSRSSPRIDLPVVEAELGAK